ncbi:MAG TPA: Crp/Fnr family transcriptional regulator [Stellaceae bacterium]|nr:Crp/Fnr family transcriptional regulator [Stellaceae bacterium]
MKSGATEPLPVAGGMQLPLTRKLGEMMPLSEDEAAILNGLQANPRSIERHRDVITEGRNYASIFAVLEGIGIRYRILRDGRRQIINLVLPGDVVGFMAAAFENTPYSTKSLTPMTISTIPFARISSLFQSSPQLVAKLLCVFSCETAVHIEHIVDLGRRSALERIAHFFMELLYRLQAVGMADERAYAIPLTQELIGDALGLSVPHVNRVLRRLREENLVVIEDQRVTIKDVAALAELADFEPGYLRRFAIRQMLEEAA